MGNCGHIWGIFLQIPFHSLAHNNTRPAGSLQIKAGFQPSSVSASSFFSRILSWATKSEAPNMVKSGISLWEILAACARSVFSKACCSNETLLFVSSAKVRIMEAEALCLRRQKAVSESKLNSGDHLGLYIRLQQVIQQSDQLLSRERAYLGIR